MSEIKCPTCGESEPGTGNCGTSDSDKKALCKVQSECSCRNESQECTEASNCRVLKMFEPTITAVARGEPVAFVDNDGVINVSRYDYKPGDKLYTHPAVAQEPVGFRYKTRSIKYPENGWSGWHFQEGVPANYHLTDDGNFEFLTRLLYDHSTPDVAPAEVVRELVEALDIAVCQNSHDMVMTGEELRRCEAALKSAKEHGL